jgi:WhiB family redox-sensing transcriptional regulator
MTSNRFEWMDYALCAQVDPELFFPDPGETGTTAAAKAVCGRCVAKAPCALFFAAFTSPDDHYGIAGGVAAPGRRRVRRELLTEAGEAA